MSLELIIRPEAEADVVQAYRWYNEQVPGLGQEFLAEVDRVIESIQFNPKLPRRSTANIGARSPDDFRMASSTPFDPAGLSYSPFCIRHGTLAFGCNGESKLARRTLAGLSTST